MIATKIHGRHHDLQVDRYEISISNDNGSFLFYVVFFLYHRED